MIPIRPAIKVSNVTTQSQYVQTGINGVLPHQQLGFSQYSLNKHKYKKSPLTFRELEPLFRRQKRLMEKKYEEIYRIIRNAVIKRQSIFKLIEKNKIKPIFLKINNKDKTKDKVYKHKISGLNYFYSYNDKKSKLMLEEPYKYNNFVWQVTFYKDEPQKMFKFKKYQTKAFIYKDKTVEIEMGKKNFFYNPRLGTKVINSQGLTNKDKKDISVSLDYLNSNPYPNSYFYSEHGKDGDRGILFNEKINGDNHTGVIAFPATYI